jgi:hypothetical protein
MRWSNLYGPTVMDSRMGDACDRVSPDSSPGDVGSAGISTEVVWAGYGSNFGCEYNEFRRRAFDVSKRQLRQI